MIYSFTLTTILSLIDFVLYASGIALFFLENETPGPTTFLSFLLILIATSGIFLIHKLSFHLYRKTMLLLNTDFSSFLQKQNKILKKTISPTVKVTVMMNIVFGCIAYEQYNMAHDELQKASDALSVSNILHPQYQIILLDREISLALQRHDLEALKNYTSQLQTVFPMIRSRNAYINDQAKLIYNLNMFEAETGCRSPQQLIDKDHLLIEHYIKFLTQTLESETLKRSQKSTPYTSLKLQFALAGMYLLTGNKDKAEKLLKLVVQSGTNYPIVSRTSEYLATGDTSPVYEVLFMVS